MRNTVKSLRFTDAKSLLFTVKTLPITEKFTKYRVYEIQNLLFTEFSEYKFYVKVYGLQTLQITVKSLLNTVKSLLNTELYRIQF